MAVRFLNREVSDLCLGKSALRLISATATVAEALSLLKRTGETHVSVWNCDHSSSPRKVVEEVTDVFVDHDECRVEKKVDVICFLCKQESLMLEFCWVVVRSEY
ncbi:hypothetical protein RND71_012162 [Anisodus tanguticus]|uniref:Uncharacterized protein n=1 Tax=Anisodus tanguticus TaxID=243964 RepID=A0AAE1SE31_9SOLA|nr:hypothetical protein RND71_012162 [Anisodus tanguticus]